MGRFLDEAPSSGGKFIDPMFKSEEEGRAALKQIERENKQLAWSASTPGFIMDQVVGGVNTAIDTALAGGLEATYNLFGQTAIPKGTAESVKGIGAGVGALVPTGAVVKSGQALGSGLKGTLVGKSARRAILSKEADKFARQVQKEFVGIKSAAVQRWDEGVQRLAAANPNKMVSLRNVVDDIIVNKEVLSPEARNVFMKTPLLKKFIENPSLADNVSLRDAQSIINYINTKVPSTIKYNNLDLLDVLSDIKASQLDAFPEMANMRMDYAKIAEPWKNIKNNFKFNKTLQAINTDFGGPQAQEAVKALFSEQTIKEMGGYKNAIKAVKAIKAALGWGVAGSLLGVGGKAGYELTK